MDSELKSMLDRADELLDELKDEYESSLKANKVTEKAKNLTHEALEKLKNALNHTMAKVWEKIIAPDLSDEDKKERAISFPTSDNLNSFRSVLGRAKMTGADKTHKNLYDFLLRKQPFSSSDNQWLRLLSEISGKGKHVGLTPQKMQKVTHRKKYKSKGLFVISLDGDIPKLIAGVQDTSKPVHPKTQTVLPAPDIVEIEEWTIFVFNGYGVNAFAFCNEAYKKTCALVDEMIKVFKL